MNPQALLNPNALPAFSVQLHPGEARLESTPPSQGLIPPTGTFRKQCKHFTLSVFDQEPSAATPLLDRNSMVTGMIAFHSIPSSSMLKVQLKLQGRLSTSTLGMNSGSKIVNTVGETVVLWQRPQESALTSQNPAECPRILPYSMPFPSTFLYREEIFFTPPTHDIQQPLGNGVYSKAKYSLIVEITSKGLLGKKVKSLRIPVTYVPRERPSLEICPQRNLFDTVKVLPEEWSETIAILKPECSMSHLEPITALFFVSDVRTFGLKDAIPFHLQLSGPLESLSKLVPTEQSRQYRIRVFLERRVSIRIHETDMVTRVSIGEGEVRALPPPAQDGLSTPETVVCDWEGNVKLRDPSQEPATFSAANVIIKDYMVLSITPSYHRQPTFEPLRISIPIRFVTDTWDAIFASEDEIGLV